MDRSVIILAGGSSTGFSSDKGLLELNGKPLLSHVINAVEGLADEVIMVTSSKTRADAYAKLVSPDIKFTVDVCESKGPLLGALTGFEAAEGEYSLLLPFDSPFVSTEIMTMLFECAVGKSAAVARWTSGEIEPLHAVYNTKKALDAAKRALAEGELDLDAMVCKMQGVRYISTLVLEQIDPDLKTFFSVNTPLDLKKATVMLKPRKTSKQPKPRLKKM